MNRPGSRRIETFASALTLGLWAASCTAILGINNDYREGSVFSSDAGGSGGSAEDGGSATTSSSTGSGGGTTSSSASAASGTASTSASSGAGGGPVVVWRSWDTQTSGNPPMLSVLDTNGQHQAVINPYKSQSLMDLNVHNAFPAFNPGQHPDVFNHVSDYWTHTPGDYYPYVGKSNVPRGKDTGEQNAPPPAGVSDLELAPTDAISLVVAAFVAPFSGDYTISDLSVRRVSNAGNLAALRVFLGNTAVGPMMLVATGNQAWVNDKMTYPLGMLTVGTEIRFAVDAMGDDKEDATEIAWTLTAK